MQLSEVLRLFDSPLSQEQCWSICYQVCKNLISMRNEDLQRKERIHYILSLDSLILTQRGEVEILQSEPSFQALQRDSELIFAIGNLICRCLDYGLDDDQIYQVKFQDDLAELIAGMVLLNQEYDEGISDGDSLNDSWSSLKYSSASRGFRSLSEVVQFSKIRLEERNIEPKENHYKSVCQALFIEVSELKAFLGHVLDDFHTKDVNTCDLGSERQNFAKKYVKEWARLWIKVMDELRQKMSERREIITPEDYQITPFEKMKFESCDVNFNIVKYDLQRSESLPCDAEEQIISFLRSRVSSSDELTESFNKRETKSCENLQSFANNHKNELIKLQNGKLGKYKSFSEKDISVLRDIEREIDIDDNSESESTIGEFNDSNENEKVVLAIDNNLSRRIEDWETQSAEDKIEEEFLNGEIESENEDTLNSPRQQNTVMRNDSLVRKRLPLSPQIVEVITDSSVEAPRLTPNNAFFPTDFKDSGLRRHTYSYRPSGKHYQSEMNLHRASMEESFTEKLGCSLTEILKIRQEITRSELESSKDILLKESKICFGCRKVKFSYFQRPRHCSVCARKYCIKCINEKSQISESLVSAFPPNIDIHYRGESLTSLAFGMTKSVGNLHTLLQQSRDNAPWLEASGKNCLFLNMCRDCKEFLESIDKERMKNTEWNVHLEIDF